VAKEVKTAPVTPKKPALLKIIKKENCSIIDPEATLAKSKQKAKITPIAKTVEGIQNKNTIGNQIQAIAIKGDKAALERSKATQEAIDKIKIVKTYIDKLQEIATVAVPIPPQQKKPIMPLLRGDIEVARLVESFRAKLAESLAPKLLILSGNLANNIKQGSLDDCSTQSHINLYHRIATEKLQAMTNSMIANPAIIEPTWRILTNNLVIRLKIVALRDLGWKKKIFPKRSFGALYLLAHLLDPELTIRIPLPPILKKPSKSK
jgi:hypothetical protein